MSDVLRDIAVIGAWTGLSTGAVIALGALAWFVPVVRTVAIGGAITVASYNTLSAAITTLEAVYSSYSISVTSAK